MKENQLSQLQNERLNEFHTNIPYIEKQISNITNFGSLIKYLIHYMEKQHPQFQVISQRSSFIIYDDDKKKHRLKNLRPYNKKHVNFQILLLNVPKHVSFNQILQMEFSNIELNNCQFLTFLHLPSLRSLIFDGSKIHNFKSIQKTQFPSLKFLNFSNSLAPQLNLSRHKFYEPTKHLAFEQYGHFSLVSQNLSLMAKIQSQNLQIIWITSHQMIKQWSTQSVLSQKFQKAKFYKHAYWFAC